MTRWFFIGVFVCCACTLVACDRREATRADCEQILNRIITIELGELGYRDPAFAARKQTELRERMRSRLDECVGRPLPPKALPCIANAMTTEALSHECLR